MGNRVDGSAQPKLLPEALISFPGKSSKRNGRHFAFRSVSSSEVRLTTSEVDL